MLSKYDYPRPEYPRPERQRGLIEGVDWLNLNGPWQFRFDGDRIGLEEKWYQPKGTDWREQIIVPFCWESLAAWGEGDAAGNENFYAMRVFKNPLKVDRTNHRAAERYEVGWYRKKIRVPTEGAWLDKRVYLTIGAADFRTDVWCNGVYVDGHEGGYEPIELDITDSLKPAKDGFREGLIVIRVEDPMDHRQQPVGKQWEWYTTTSGIWQTVFLEPRSQSHIKHYKVYTDIDAGTARFDVSIEHAHDGLEVEWIIETPSGVVKNHQARVENGVAKATIDLSPVALWDPNDPQLYQLHLKLWSPRRHELDLVRSYFGMRKIDTALRDDSKAPGALRLNGNPIYLRGALYQSYFPDGVYTAGDAKTIRQDILLAKEAGFDFLRVHIKMDDPLLYYYADTLGILLMVDFPNFGEGGDSPVARSRFEKMMRIGIDRDFNHPSIIAWCLFNETWGFGGQTELVKHFTHQSAEKYLQSVTEFGSALTPTSKLANLNAHEWVNSIWSLAKKLDPTRLIEDMSVVHWDHLEYYQHVETDINSWHFYNSDYYSAREHIEKIVTNTYSGSSFNYVTGYKQANQPLINSEYGGVGALDGDTDISWSFKFLTNELRRHPTISAYVFTQLHDVEWEYNGFINYDRTPKQFGYDPAFVNHGDVLAVDVAPMQRIEPGGTWSVPVFSSHYSRKKRQNVVLEWRLSGIDTIGQIHADVVRGAEAIPFPHRQVVLAKDLKINLPKKTMLCKLTLNALTETGERVAQNYVECLSSAGYPESVEEIERARILRMRPHEWAEAEWTDRFSTQAEAEAADFCFGLGKGFFEWHMPLTLKDLKRARRLKILCEASAHRTDHPQTSLDAHPSMLEICLNDTSVFRAALPDHPYDSRGSLSYLRGGKGAYGYLSYILAEGPLLEQIVQQGSEQFLRFRCLLPENASAFGGLTIYGAECGRYPICPTVVVEW